MRKFKHYLILTLTASIFGIIGCNPNEATEQINETIRNEVGHISDTEEVVGNTNNNSHKKNPGGTLFENTDNTEPWQTADLEIYNNIIQQYIDLINNNYYEKITYAYSEEWNEVGPDLNPELIYLLKEKDDFKFYYALCDIDKNGVPELFLGGSFLNNKITYYDMFSYDNIKGVNPFAAMDYMNFGYRTNLYINADGIIEVHWADSGTHHGRDYYKISADDFQLELLDSISLKPKNLETACFYSNNEYEQEISQEEFDAIIQKYQDADKMIMQWIEIER